MHIPLHDYEIEVCSKFVQHWFKHFRQIFYVWAHGNVCATFKDKRDRIIAREEEGTWQSYLRQ